MNLNFNADENEKLLTFTAAVRSKTEEGFAAVVLVGTGSQHVLCRCDEEADAHLVKKLFNSGLRIPNP